ncbi:TNF receptor-associated factor 3 [Rhipicephalus sanguineus]|uniref:TNF receptor-associated factor 3 n=1 Tax=Rhipicephalus sanguineus TaxID=34632 RepID=UPI001894D0FA|nr:TNF receptor-associated factor 3 [Rhipicephalus sanguineus]
MPDRGGRPALYRLCDSVNGTNWRPTRFEDELTLIRYACCVCHVIPSTTIVLPCSHALCEQCMKGCVVQSGGSVCPLDTELFFEDECQRCRLPAKRKQNLKAHCWNEADGCQFVGTIEAVLLHFDRECAFHALQCPRCEQRILRTGIAAHYVAGCSQNASCASGAQKSRQDGPSTSCDTSVIVDQFCTLQRQMNEVSARSQDISRAVSGFENTLQRGMESIEANICTMVTRQLNAGVEELKASNIEPCSDNLSSLQSQMNELVEQSRQRDASQIQEIGRVLRDSQIEVKEDLKVHLQKIVPVLEVSVTEVKENVKTQLKELVHVVRDSGCGLKEHVSRVEANLSSRLTDQQQSLQGALDSLKPNHESSEGEGSLAAAASGEEIPWCIKQDVFINESLNTLELLRQQIYRRDKEPWVSESKDLMSPPCAIFSDYSKIPGFLVTLENCEIIWKSGSGFSTVTYRYYRDMYIHITFSKQSWTTACFYLESVS